MRVPLLVWLLLLALLGSCRQVGTAPSPAPAPEAAPQAPNQFPPDLIYQDRVPPDYPLAVDPGLSALLEAVAPQPGMKALVLGPESGYLSFPLARAVGPKGQVLTLCDYRFNQAWLADRAAEAGLANLQAAFFPEFQWDSLPEGAFQRIVLLDFRSQSPADRDLLPRLVRALAPGGRVLVLHRRELVTFTPRALWSPPEALRQLCVFGAGFPLRQRLKPDFEARIAGACAAGGNPWPDFAPAFLAALNRLEDDRTLYRDLSAFFNQRSGFAAELTAFFGEDAPLRVLQWYDNAFGHLLLDETEDLGPDGALAVRVVNHLVLAAIFAIKPQRPDRFVEGSMLWNPVLVSSAWKAAGLLDAQGCRDFSTHHCQAFLAPGGQP